jgi:hypothetical protein
VIEILKLHLQGILREKNLNMPMTVAAWYAARNVFVGSKTGILGSHPTGNTDVCPHSSSVSVVL